MAKYASIPVPQLSLDSLQQTCMRMKETLDQITGISSGVRSAGLYVQDTMPEADRDGRLWLCTLGTNITLNVAYNGKWLKVSNLT
jgi:hypothetical protein